MTVLTREDYVSLVSKLAESVYDFHARFNLLEQVSMGFFSEDLVPERILLTIEELGELTKAYMREGSEQVNEEAADLLYIALGTLLFLGEEGAVKAQAVISKNAQKTNKTHAVNSTGKVVKLAPLSGTSMKISLVEQARCEVCKKFVTEGKKLCSYCKKNTVSV